ncbi:outer envelope protein 64 [Hibiscus syriacus]|uniref:Outer envelope protein 64 n=1 Tax=Hibiscus syriacus TaxID=106335 RepID=A0A6A3BL50_HIBSY|nr:outer envelope protein 64 [Hibiscus syriacus]
MAALEEILGLLRIHVKRGVNLAVRDSLKTRVIDTDVNPVWNEDLTLSITDPDMPIQLTVYDYDRFSMDDEMGDAEFSIKTFIQALRLDYADFPNGTILSKVQPCRKKLLGGREQHRIEGREGCSRPLPEIEKRGVW